MIGISDAQWGVYKNIIDNAHTFFNQDVVIWRRLRTGLQRYGEDDPNNNSYDDINLRCLITYNIFRTWPINKNTPSGLLDRENEVMMLNKQYLQDAGFINSDGFFDFDPGNDLFIHKGQVYRSMGETPISQAKEDPLHFYIVLIRQRTETGNSKY